MIDCLETEAEKKAQAAENLKCFNGLNLLHIKRQVEIILGLIGKNSFFDQYTRHDITHIDEMLKILEWLIPESTKPAMSVTDWLMIVLAIYFHDMGMLVTEEEYQNRNDSGFHDFCDKVLFYGENGIEYKAKIEFLSPEMRNRFLYQEFVRKNHAARIKNWIVGSDTSRLGNATKPRKEVVNLLKPLGDKFREDLGLVCESHHLDDLHNICKYGIAQPYGNSEAETANLQYCSVLLRAADLLHITSDRTPAIEFRLISPTDPVSQEEWSKQSAVKRVRSKVAQDKNGNFDDAAPRDTIEICAHFTKVNGFFGLNAYIEMAIQELKKCNDWITQTSRKGKSKHEFPWRHLDDSNITTKGFEKQLFEFSIDQKKILDLLTGHTLYNNTNVVMREIVQNSIDAIRLQYYPDDAKTYGVIKIKWDSKKRCLSIQDNGTGMSAQIINDYLLRVGASRYQDAELMKKYPNFNSISRFGIGVLSSFMISDNVEIITCHPDDVEAHHLELRSATGKYLMRLIEKDSCEAREVGEHGTIFRLRIRQSINMDDVVETARRWIVFPDCRVTVQVDEEAPESVGHETPSDALKALLLNTDWDYSVPTEGEDVQARRSTATIKIEERKVHGVCVAYVLIWNRAFKDWSFLTVEHLVDRMNRLKSGKKEIILGTCIEGIRIEMNTPGFKDNPIIAIANVVGQSSPRTNVARTGIEDSVEKKDMLRSIYSIYADYCINEFNQLTGTYGFSEAWAVGEVSFLARALLKDKNRTDSGAQDPELLEEALGAIPGVMVEENQERRARTNNEMREYDAVWTIDCELLTSASLLVREVATKASLSSIIAALKIDDFKFHGDPLIVNYSHDRSAIDNVLNMREVDEIYIDTKYRRVDLRWTKKAQDLKWLSIRIASNISVIRYLVSQGRSLSFPLVPNVAIKCVAPRDISAFRACEQMFLLPGTELASFALRYMLLANSGSLANESIGGLVVVIMISDMLNRGVVPGTCEELERLFSKYASPTGINVFKDMGGFGLDYNEFMRVIKNTQWSVYNPHAWQRKEKE